MRTCQSSALLQKWGAQSTRGRFQIGRLSGLDLGIEFGAKFGEKAEHRPSRCVSERTDGVADDAAGDRSAQVHIAGMTIANGDALADPSQPAGAFAARCALATRFMGIELHDARTNRDKI